jgi:hypothetical protein
LLVRNIDSRDNVIIDDDRPSFLGQSGNEKKAIHKEHQQAPSIRGTTYPAGTVVG